tara:strand:+ start:314 stop:619 length:306 start_codon:yes stop_codon:yes gene_type:complete
MGSFFVFIYRKSLFHIYLYFKAMVKIYIIGLCILIIAIIANAIVVRLGIASWYGFINLLNEEGIKTFRIISIIDYLWLFLGYPLVLGFGYVVGIRLYNLIF